MVIFGSGAVDEGEQKNLTKVYLDAFSYIFDIL